MTRAQFWSFWDRWRFDARRESGRAYGVAALIFLAAFMGRLLLDEIVPERLPFITFFPAVLLAGFFGGTVAGVGVLIASAVMGALWFGPTGTLGRLLSFLLFVLTAGIQVLLLHLIDRSVQRVRESERQLAVINRELKHRLKNVLTLADAVFRQSLKAGASPDELRQTVSGRLQAMAAAQELMSIAADDGSGIDALIDAVVAPLAPHGTRLITRGPATALPADSTTPVALVLHELATNAVKHGAWRGENGRVTITWKMLTDGAAPLCRLKWQEEGGGPMAHSGRQGFGTLLLKGFLPGARVSHEVKADGLHCAIVLTANPRVPSPADATGLATLFS